MVKTIMIIGYGQTGKNHFNTLKYIQNVEKKVYVSSIVDIDRDKTEELAGKNILVYTEVEKAIYEKKPDIVLVAANTSYHKETIETILKNKIKWFPALFIEEPLTENIEDAYDIVNKLKAKGYEKKIPASLAYLIKESQTIQIAIDYIKSNYAKIDSFDVVWQKKRLPNRPTTGAHIDDATHSIDVIINRILKDTISGEREGTIIKSEYERNICVAEPNIQKKLHEKYGTDQFPIAAIDFEISTNGIPIRASCSYMKEPQQRSIRINLDRSGKNAIEMFFDHDKSDIYILKKDGKITDYRRFNTSEMISSKVYLEWKTFLDYCSGKNSTKITTLEDGIFDVRITKSLEAGKPNMLRSYKIHDMDWYRIDAFKKTGLATMYIWAHNVDEVKKRYETYNKDKRLRGNLIKKINPEEIVFLETDIKRRRRWDIDYAKKGIIMFKHKNLR
jgi:predicted dehydrogenase